MKFSSMTVMTSLGKGRDSYLPQTAQSISAAAQHSPLPVRWIISYSSLDYSNRDLEHLDGICGIDTTLLPIEGPVNAATGRNHAIMHADKKSIMVNCDSDDLFTEERFSMIDITQENTLWLCAADDYVDGEVIPFDTPRGGIWDYPWWEDRIETNDTTPHFKCHLATLAIPRHLAIKAGGYPALDYMEDSVFVKKVHDICSPHLIVYPHVGYLYRKHKKQSSARDYDKHQLWTTWIS